MTMERILPADWRPDDAPWANLTIAALQKQCAARNLPVSVSKFLMVMGLKHHQMEIHGTEERKFCWTQKPIGPAYESALEWAHNTKFRIVQVKDESNLNGGQIVKNFKMTRDGHKLMKVEFKHVLRYVLNCPEPLRWQQSFLSPELEEIYRHSYAVSTLLLTNWKSQDPLCALCFKVVAPAEEQRTCCFTCGRVMHIDCVGVARKVRGLAKEEKCWRCEDETEWGIDKYCGPGQVQYPLIVPGTKAATQTQPGLGGNTVQQSNERTASVAVTTEDLSSSRSEHSGKHSGKQTNNPSPINDGPVPDIAPAPASGAASVKDVSSTSTNIKISNRNSVILERYRGRLAKKSAEMQKRAKRKYKKLNKKHMKELEKHKKDLAKLRANSKRELDRFMKKSKKLERKAKSMGVEREGCENT